MSNITCGICSENCKESMTQCLTCNFYACTSCIKKWHERSRTCPGCRKPMDALTNVEESEDEESEDSEDTIVYNDNYMEDLAQIILRGGADMEDNVNNFVLNYVLNNITHPDFVERMSDMTKMINGNN